MTRHQRAISALVPQTSLFGETIWWGCEIYVFMLGALGIMRANGGYIMRTAFRRVHHAYCWVVFK